MISFAQGKPLGPGDLNILIRDESGALYDPSIISYSIFSVDSVTKAEALATMPNTVPLRNSLGIYSISMTIPSTWDGDFKLVWYVTRYAGDPFDTIYEEFQVVNFTPGRSSFEAPSLLMVPRPGMSQQGAELVVMVRELLSDTNPDRNYHFRPPTSGKVVAGFNNRVGFIWTDSTILVMIKLALAQMNMSNPLNTYSYNIDSVPESWAQIACLGAAAKCLSAEGARWISEEFGYSLNGVSLDINKASSYQALADAYANEFKELAVLASANRPASAGLRQQRFLL